MKLLRVDFDHVEGLPSGLHVDDLSSGLNVILGENGSGKSSFVAIARRTLWPTQSRRTFHARSHWMINNELVRATVMDRRVNWGDRDDIGASSLPGEHLSACFVLGIRDLLGDTNASDEELARLIRTAMRGGFDLDVVRQEFKTSDHGVRSARKSLQAASTEVAEVRRRFRELAHNEDRLHQLEERFHEAREAEARLLSLSSAEHRLTYQRQLAHTESLLQQVPAKMASLRGGEADNVNQLRETLRDNTQHRDELAREHLKITSTLQSSDLPQASVDSDVITAKLKEVNELALGNAPLRDLRAELAAATSQAQRDHQLLLAVDGAELESLGADQLNSLDEFLSTSLANAAEIRSLQRSIDQLAPAQEHSPDGHALSAAQHALSSWLKAPVKTARSREPQWLRWIALAALGLGVLGAVLATPLSLILAALGLGVLISGFVRTRLSGNNQGAESDAKAAFTLTGIKEPDSWSIESVRQCLTEITAQLAAIEATALGTQKRAELSAQLKELLTANSQLEERGEALRITTGLSLSARPMATVEAARRIAQHRQTQARVRELADRVSESHRLLTKGTSAAAEFLTEHGVECPQDADTSTITTKLAALSRHHDEQTRAAEAAERLGEEIARVNGIIEATTKKISAIFAALDLQEGDQRGFEELLDGLEGYQQLLSSQKDLQASITRCEQDLIKEPEWLSLDDAGLARVRSRLEDLKASFAARNEEWHRVKDELLRTRSGNELEAARAKESTLEEQLFELHEEALLGEAANFLLDGVEQSYKRSIRPLVLQRAMDLFSSFTQAHYQVEVTGTEKPRLVALESTTQKQLELRQLSDGTRIQLLLAVRLAFAIEQSQGRLLPIFLDESLSTSDPVRFKAVGAALLELVKHGQQIFYLTANPSDVTEWQQLCVELAAEEPKVVYLGKLREEFRAIDDPERLRSSKHTIPAPEQMSAAEYGALLRPLEPNRFALAEELDLYFPSYDRLDVLYALRCKGIKTLGQWQRLSGEDAVAQYLPSEHDRDAISARVKMARIYLERWQQGRGKPMTRIDLEQSKAVSNAFIDKISARLAAHGGSAAGLMNAISNSEIKGFRKAAASKLHDFMLDNGFLDSSAPLSPFELELAVVTAVATELSEAQLSTAMIRDFIALMDRASSNITSETA